jgi:hypothetical protein
MRRPWLLIVALVLGGCARSEPLTLTTYASERHGFSISAPGRWERTESDSGRRTWFVPRPIPQGQVPEGQATEFIVVMAEERPGPLSEPEIRRLAMTLLPMHGVSGFQRTDQSTEIAAWYRFELTGSTAGTEWASMGFLVSGPAQIRYLVCAAPLPRWREQQKLCDEVLRSFKPGDLSR